MPYAPWRGTSTLALLVTLLFVGESLAWGSLGFLPVVVVIFIVEGCVNAGGGLSSLCKAQPFLQVVYLPLDGSFVVPFLGHVATHAGVTSAGLRGIHAPLPKPSLFLVPAMLKVWEIALLLGSGWLKLMGGLIPPCPTIAFTSTQVLPTDGANCRVPIWRTPFTVDVSKPKPNRPNTMNLVEKRA